MLSSGVFGTRSAKLIAALAAMLALVIFQMAMQAKPAHAWEVNLSARGAGQVTEVTDAGLIASDCFGGLSSPQSTPTDQIGDSCSPGSPNGKYEHGWIVEYQAAAKPGYQFVRWQNHKGNEPNNYDPVLCDGWNGPNGNNNSTNPIYTGSNCRFQIFKNLQVQAVFEDRNLPPTPTINSGPTNPVRDFASFTFSPGSDPTFRNFECRVQNKTFFQTCSSGFSVNVSNGFADGTYTFEVRSVDYSNNTSLGSATRQFTVDRTAPTTTISLGPEDGSTTQDRSASFSFISDESGSFFCSLSGPGLPSPTFAPCSLGNVTSGTRSFTDLKDGTYTFKVRATDIAGNAGNPVQRTWTVNNSPTVLEDLLAPARGAKNVLRNTDVSATFSEEMSSTSLREADNTSKTFKLQMYVKKSGKWKAIPATIALSLEGGKTKATLDPYGAIEGTTGDKPLAGNKKFRGMITTGAKDLDSNPLAKSFVWIFNTGELTG